MTTDDVRTRLRTKLETAYGAEEASYLMDRPPGGWNDLVTTQVLDLRLSALESRLTAQMANLAAELRKEMRDQTWRLMTTLIATITLMSVILRVV